MKISKSVVAVAVSSVLLFGCDFDVGPQSNAPAAGNGNSGSVVVPGPGGSAANKLVQITDTSTSDTGELRLKLADGSTQAVVPSIAKGKLTVDLTYVNEDPTQIDDGNGNNAYITLFGSGTSNSNLVGEIALNNDGDIFHRTNQGKPDLSTTPDTSFKAGDKVAVEMTWGDGEYSFKVDGKSFGPFPCSAETAPVQVIALKMGDNSHTTPYKLLVDNFKVYNVAATGDEKVFADDFEGRAVGQDLSGNPYNSNSNEAVVIGEGGTDAGNGVATGAVTEDFEGYSIGAAVDSTYKVKGDADATALIAADPANANGKALQIKDGSTATKPVVGREFANGAADTGSVSASFYVSKDGYNKKSSYLYLGTDAGASSGKRFAEVVIGGDSVKFREADGSTQTVLQKYTRDTWVNVAISWKGTDVTVTVDGTEYKGLVAENASAGAPSAFAMYGGDNSSTGTITYFDNLNSDLF
ncbi:hypothetical protein A9264_05435 [Vibrio sp. UCD-FRSSP16_10]|uniref:hypothetical protein n=1 Tax=unclassified Vibrio TaxID=2614977 RepID=UPI0007FF7C97|nr:MULTISPECIES: hypothetical protein [unclassified Vibrio]OBT07913.1 hypothetical protein A9260_07675 [Vibrio sp. UCD-FRSSP16_30]OBT17088.1 hypothetical protein A9264_05435 [Vibrio sp. UCD-FRSSP16_10]